MKIEVERSTWEHLARWAYYGYQLYGRLAIVLDTQAPSPAGPLGSPRPAAETLAAECSFPADWLQAVAGYDPERELVLLCGPSVFVLSVDANHSPRQLYEQHAAALASVAQ